MHLRSRETDVEDLRSRRGKRNVKDGKVEDAQEAQQRFPEYMILNR
jgi:hypothetical protein